MTGMHPVDPTTTRPVAPGATDPSGGVGAANPAFRRLLDSLENLARTPAPAVGDADGLQDALRRADDDYVAAMDLRRRLEEAVRGGR